MSAVQSLRSTPPPLIGGMTLRQLEWTTIVGPVAFVMLHHFLMMWPLHPFFHRWYGFTVMVIPLSLAVWLFSRAVFRAIRGMQEEIEVLHEQAEALLVERERQHIAREMHDGLAQVLSFVNTKAQAVELLLRQGNSAAAQDHMSELAAAARRVYGDVREGIVALRVEVKGDRGFRDVVDDYVEEFRHFARLPVEVHWEVQNDALALPPVAEVQVLRIVQEALTNVRRHARARSAEVTFSAQGDDLHVVVRDDGAGFDPSRVARGEWPQFGLRAMRERAEAIGGTLELESAPGQGTVVRAVLPGTVHRETVSAATAQR